MCSINCDSVGIVRKSNAIELTLTKIRTSKTNSSIFIRFCRYESLSPRSCIVRNLIKNSPTLYLLIGLQITLTSWKVNSEQHTVELIKFHLLLTYQFVPHLQVDWHFDSWRWRNAFVFLRANRSPCSSFVQWQDQYWTPGTWLFFSLKIRPYFAWWDCSLQEASLSVAFDAAALSDRARFRILKKVDCCEKSDYSSNIHFKINLDIYKI